MRSATIAIAAVLALATLQAHAINKCIERNGKVSYQNGPCPANTRQENVKVYAPPPPPPSKGPAQPVSPLNAWGLVKPDQDGPDPVMDQLVSTMTTYEGCETAAPAFAKAHGAQYEAWRSSNASLLDRLTRSQRYRRVLQSERKKVAIQLAQPSSRKAFEDSCPERLAGALGDKKKTPR